MERITKIDVTHEPVNWPRCHKGESLLPEDEWYCDCKKHSALKSFMSFSVNFSRYPVKRKHEIINNTHVFIYDFPHRETVQHIIIVSQPWHIIIVYRGIPFTIPYLPFRDRIDEIERAYSVCRLLTTEISTEELYELMYPDEYEYDDDDDDDTDDVDDIDDTDSMTAIDSSS